jgi:hypothetical protein
LDSVRKSLTAKPSNHFAEAKNLGTSWLCQKSLQPI